MTRLAGAALFLGLFGLAVFWLLTRPASLPADTLALLRTHPADAVRGETIFWAGGCASCHLPADVEFPPDDVAELRLTGGRAFATPFGTFRAPNVSMHPEYGIGAWTVEDFARATLLGVSPEGAHYYPAFPFTTYTRAAPEDVADLWAFWQSLPEDATPSAPHEVGFPFSMRRGLGLWKQMNLDAAYATPAFAEAELDRGRYLVEALGHCAECHTPRDSLGGLDRDLWMQGGPNPSGEGRIPALPPEGWTAFDVAAYLETGFTPEFDSAGGEMADVIANMSRLTDADREAIAAYVMALRSSPNR